MIRFKFQIITQFYNSIRISGKIMSLSEFPNPGKSGTKISNSSFRQSTVSLKYLPFVHIPCSINSLGFCFLPSRLYATFACERITFFIILYFKGNRKIFKMKLASYSNTLKNPSLHRFPLQVATQTQQMKHYQEGLQLRKPPGILPHLLHLDWYFSLQIQY
jgi:hypothetical protein